MERDPVHTWALGGSVAGLTVAIFALLSAILSIVNLQTNTGVIFRTNFFNFEIAMILISIGAVIMTSLSLSRINTAREALSIRTVPYVEHQLTDPMVNLFH